MAETSPEPENAPGSFDVLEGYRDLAEVLKADCEAIRAIQEETGSLVTLRDEMLSRRKALLNNLEDEEATTEALKIGIRIEQYVVKLQELQVRLTSAREALKGTFEIFTINFSGLSGSLEQFLIGHIEKTISDLITPASRSYFCYGPGNFASMIARESIVVVEFRPLMIRRLDSLPDYERQAEAMLAKVQPLLSEVMKWTEQGFQVPSVLSREEKLRTDAQAAQRHAEQMRSEQEQRERREREEREARVNRGKQVPGVTFHDTPAVAT